MSGSSSIDIRRPWPPSPPPPLPEGSVIELPDLELGDPEDRATSLRDYLERSRGHLRELHRSGTSGMSLARLLSVVMDRMLWGLAGSLASPSGGWALVALGSYARRQLSPRSDLDLLLLHSASLDERTLTPFARALHTALWDLKIRVGWSVRTLEECRAAAAEEHTVRTAFLELRPVAGDPSLAEELSGELERTLTPRVADELVAAKVAELKARRERFGDSVYLLEPDVKVGQGGLRDLEAALWITRARFRAGELRELLRRSLLSSSEVARGEAARDLLMRIRHELHFIKGRKQDRLTFDLQEEAAATFGYSSSEEGLSVEKFMRDYYLSARTLRRISDTLIERSEEARRPGTHAIPRRRGAFRVLKGKLVPSIDGRRFQERPERVVEMFRIAEEEGAALHPLARDQVLDALPALSAAADRPEVVAALRELLIRPGSRGQALEAMHELGALGVLIPEFGWLTARHQHVLFHRYTVDVHSLFALKRLYALRAGALHEEEPALTREMRALGDPLPLYLGMLLHDCGKGLGGDHSEKGAVRALEAARRLDLTERQSEILAFLVKHHLTMSQTAQRRDLSDPDLIGWFADEVEDLERLRCLYLLTYADMWAVAPGTWNEWRAALISELYQKARDHLLGRASSPADPRALFVRRWTAAFGHDRAEELGRALADRYFLCADPSDATWHGRLLFRARRAGMALAVRRRPERYSEVSLCLPDRSGLLATVAGVLSAHSVDILRAEVHSTEDGFALDAFSVRAPTGRPLERSRWRAARADLGRVLAGEETVDALLSSRRGSALLTRPLPPVRPRVVVDNRASRQYTVVDVQAEDRPGLLYALAGAIRDVGAAIVLAQVSTEGNRAVDSFYLWRKGAKLQAPAEVEALRERLLSAVDGG